MRATLTVRGIWLVCLGAAAQFDTFAVLFDRVASAYPGQPGPMIGLPISTVGVRRVGIRDLGGSVRIGGYRKRPC